MMKQKRRLTTFLDICSAVLMDIKLKKYELYNMYLRHNIIINFIDISILISDVENYEFLFANLNKCIVQFIKKLYFLILLNYNSNIYFLSYLMP